MPESNYQEALRLGKREYRESLRRGEHPYLPVLDSIVPPERSAAGKELGLVQAPAAFIVGTKTAGRTNAFARNFMPLLEEQTEFADKWKRLCAAHLKEGIREPVKLYEYMNRYYVEEGNKRVSVLKFFGAVSVPALVTRVWPERNGDPDVELYYELTEFQRLSGIYELEFTKPGSGRAMQALMGKAPEESWTEEDRRGFTAVLHNFRQAYARLGGARLTSTPGDALLAYARVYGLGSLRGKGAQEMEKLISRVWEELALQQERAPIDVKLAPEGTKPGLLTRLTGEARVRRVAFIYDKTPEISKWAQEHEMGRQHVQRAFGGRIETSAYYEAMERGADETLERAIRDGNTLLFTTSPRLLPASLRAAVEHPEATLFNCSLNQSHRYIRTYYARMYEVKFVAGAVAGALAGARDIGYICDYPIFGQIAGINAFALGVAMVNTRARVRLEWSGKDSVKAALARLTDEGVLLVSSQDSTRMEEGGQYSFGLSVMGEKGQVNLARTTWNWGVYYETLLRRVLDRSEQAQYEESSRALNYYWGLSAGVVGIRLADALPDGVRKLANVLVDAIRAGLCDPFSGPLDAQSGRISHGALTPEQLINMDWLARNVVGSIPAYDELTETGKRTVDVAGVAPSLKKE